MRSGHIAWIGAVVTFVAVVTVSLWGTGNPADTGGSRLTPHRSQPVAQASSPKTSSEDIASTAAVEHGPTDPVQPEFEPPEDARAMMDVARTSSDPDVRDEAAALSQAMDAESEPASE